MALRSALSRPVVVPSVLHRYPPRTAIQARRRYATVQPVTLVGKAPGPPQTSVPPPIAAPSALDAFVLSALRNPESRGSSASLASVVRQYEENAGAVLDVPLQYESRPGQGRRVSFERSDGVVMVAHAIQHGDAHKVALCTGFVLNASLREGKEEAGETMIVTCAHTLEEVNIPCALASVVAD